ncbi:hypothetical protein H0H92_000786 [Tricholoma furcatifolium]|nr:hypothetical protein H0H92_000786 [Tricholoma furcatifolium]
MSSNTITLPSPGNYSGALHNYLQERKQAHLLSWAEVSTMVSNSTQWTCLQRRQLVLIFELVNGEIKGTGVALQKAAAKQAAAKQACEALMNE